MLDRRTLLGMLATLAATLPACAAPEKPAQEEEPRFTVIKGVDKPAALTLHLFFAYTCPHCRTFEPLFMKWAWAHPDVKVVHVPVAWTATNDRFVRTYFTIKALGKLRELHAKFHDAVISGENFSSPLQISAWAARNGIERSKWLSVYTSEEVKQQTAWARAAWESADIQGTPCVSVGGKYLTGPGMTGGNESAIEEMARLVEKVRREL